MGGGGGVTPHSLPQRGLVFRILVEELHDVQQALHVPGGGDGHPTATPNGGDTNKGTGAQHPTLLNHPVLRGRGMHARAPTPQHGNHGDSRDRASPRRSQRFAHLPYVCLNRGALPGPATPQLPPSSPPPPSATGSAGTELRTQTTRHVVAGSWERGQAASP